MSCYKSDTEIENVVRAFEACEIDKDEFKHRQHLTVAVWYVQNLGREAALERMRAGLFRFLDHHQVNPEKYSEAITVFWIEQVARRLSELGTEISFVEKCNRIIESADFEARIFADKSAD